MSNGKTDKDVRDNMTRKLVEYTCYTNVGSNMADIMLAVRYSTQ